MESSVQEGYLVIADISGYTSFMAGSELDHAREILREVLTLVLSKLSSVLTLMEVEGDALFLHAHRDRVRRGETILEAIEWAYVEFRDHIASMKRATTCSCRACNAAPMLDLKFFVHFGEYAMQSIAGRTKIVGSSVNLIHRLLKNRVAEQTGWNAYVLITDEALKEMGIQPDDMHVSSEVYEHLGRIATNTFDLKKRFTELTDLRRVVVEDDEADFFTDGEFPVPPARLWEWLNDPARRELWMDGTTWSIRERKGGRIGVGTVAHCAHGGGDTFERIVDWRPFNYLTCDGKGGPIRYRMTIRLQPGDGGSSHARMLCLLLTPLPHWMTRAIGRLLFRRAFNMPGLWTRLREEIDKANAHVDVATEGNAIAGPVGGD